MLDRRERHYLEILREPGATICKGLAIGEQLRRKGFVAFAKRDRYGITERGRAALEGREEARCPGRPGHASSVASPSAAARHPSRGTPAAKRSSAASAGAASLPLFEGVEQPSEEELGNSIGL